ncbi:MAG: hypothetical protein ACLT9Y_00425 [Peptostreptococcus anaerobius]
MDVVLKRMEESKKEATKTEEKMKIEVSEKNPIIVDKKAKTVTVLFSGEW